MLNEPTRMGCAVGHDGQLLNPSQIQWFHDVDDDIPLPSTVTSTTTGNPLSLTIHIPSPVVRITGQCLEQVSQPSHCLTDPANAVHACKCKASSAELSSQEGSVSQDQSYRDSSNDAVYFPVDADTDDLKVIDMTEWLCE